MTDRHTKRAIVVLLTLMAAYAAAVEWTTRSVLDPISKVQRTRKAERAAAVTIKPVTANGKRTILVAGNSLLGAAVDMKLLNEGLGPELSASRFVITDTAYLEWRSGLQRLLEEGARPAVVVLMLSPAQLISNRQPVSYASYYLLRVQDLPAIGHTAGMHPTDVTGLLLSRFSLFYGMRAPLRNMLVERAIPGFEDLTKLLKQQPSSQGLDLSLVARVSSERLNEISALTGQYGVKAVLAVPPSPAASAAAEGQSVQASAKRSGVPVLLADADGEWAGSYFLDGFHMNGRGAALYSPRLASQLRKLLELSPSPSPRQ